MIVEKACCAEFGVRLFQFTHGARASSKDHTTKSFLLSLKQKCERSFDFSCIIENLVYNVGNIDSETLINPIMSIILWPNEGHKRRSKKIYGSIHVDQCSALIQILLGLS